MRYYIYGPKYMDRTRMQDIMPRFTEKHIEKLYPEISPEGRAEAAENLSQYFRVVAEIYDDLKAKGKLKDVLLRAQYEKRNRNKPALQNEAEASDETSTPTGEANEFAA